MQLTPLAPRCQPSPSQENLQDQLLRKQLIRRFGALPGWAEAKLAGTGTVQLEAWGERVLDAATLEDIFTGES